MLKNKKGQGISINYIIIIALALIVLVVIAIYFTGGLDFLFGAQSGVIGGTVDDQTKNIWRSSCNLWCSMGNEASFNNHVFQEPNKDANEIYSCSGLATADDGTGTKTLSVSCDKF